MSNPASLFTFPDGDLSIVLTHEGERVVGKVSSSAMARASPIWRKFIHPPFGRLGRARRESFEFDDNELSEGYLTSEKKAGVCSNAHEADIEEPGMVVALSGDQTVSVDSESDEEPELDFQDDDSEALLLLLRIAHVQFVGIPTTLPYKTLLSVAVIVDQYDCVEFIQPWVQNWLANENSESLKEGQTNWLFIAWALGRETVLQNLAKKCVRDVLYAGSIPYSSLYTFLQPGNFLEGPSPPLLIESILECRQLEMQSILDLVYKVVQSLERKFPEGNSPVLPRLEPRAIKCRHGNIDCDAISYGSLVLNLLDLELWPAKSVKDLNSFSLDTLLWHLKSIKIQQLPDFVHHGVRKSHKDCLPSDIPRELDNLNAQRRSPVLDSHTRHMRIQHGRLNPHPRG